MAGGATGSASLSAEDVAKAAKTARAIKAVTERMYALGLLRTSSPVSVVRSCAGSIELSFCNTSSKPVDQGSAVVSPS